MSKLKYRIKKTTAVSGKSWYMPQKRLRFLFIPYWVNIDCGIPFGQLGYETKEQASYEIGCEMLKESVIEKMIDDKTPKKSQFFGINEEEAYSQLRSYILTKKTEPQ
jgi:hypothetical protein